MVLLREFDILNGGIACIATKTRTGKWIWNMFFDPFMNKIGGV
jgi:hypothetical protein